LVIRLFVSGIVDISATKHGSVPLSGRKLQGLRKLSPDLISKAIDETNAQVTRIGLTFVGTAAFCLLSLFSPDSALLGGSEKINVPLAGPVSFFGFMLLGPAVLIMLRVYLQIFVEHSNRLEQLGRSMLAVRAPTMMPLKNPLIRVVGGLVFYTLLPVAMMLFAWKAAVFPAWGLALFSTAAAVIAGHVMLPSSRLSWRSKGFGSVSVAIIAGGVLLAFGPPHRPFDLHRANLSGQWLQGEKNLHRADLGNANLSGANLLGADLSGADLSYANLSGADLSYANLSEANLVSAKPRGADLSGADLSGTDLSGADLSEANLGGANLSHANLPGANLSGADLSAENLVGELGGANLSEANLSYANLSGANLSGTDLSGANLSGATNLAQTRLDEACGNANTKLPEGLTLKLCSPD
jgi:uncharacterized protein YjbI with pentapeptide repeats